MEMQNLFPILLPASEHFHGLSQALKSSALFLSWVELRGDSIVYLNLSQVESFSRSGLDVHEHALQNLRESAGKQFQTHQKKNERGTLMIAFMNDDGLGPSRLLLAEKLQEFFPQGYFVAVPERSCGMAIRKDMTGDEEKLMRELVHGCFTEGTKPVLDALLPPSDLLKV